MNTLKGKSKLNNFEYYWIVDVVPRFYEKANNKN